MNLKDQVKRATNTEKVRLAYLETPTAFPGEIAERTGLTKSQVNGARSSLVHGGQLPRMYGYGGAIHQENPEPLNSALDRVMSDYKVTAR
jgi:hypothetical protein